MPLFRDVTDYRPPAAQELASRAARFADEMATRRTVRSFSRQAIPREVLSDLVRAAASAPSGANQQPWHFAVVTDAAIKSEIRRAAEAEEEKFYDQRATEDWKRALRPLGTGRVKHFLEQAPALIAIFVQRWSEGAEEERIVHYHPRESVGIATGILVAAVHQAGLTSLTYTPSPMGFLSDALGRPRSEVPYLLVALGYPADDAEVPDIQRKPLDQVASFY